MYTIPRFYQPKNFFTSFPESAAQPATWLLWQGHGQRAGAPRVGAAGELTLMDGAVWRCPALVSAIDSATGCPAKSTVTHRVQQSGYNGRFSSTMAWSMICCLLWNTTSEGW